MPEDAAVMFAAYAQDPDVARYLTWRPHETVSESAAVIERFLDAWTRRSGFNWLIFTRANPELIGAIGLRREPHGVELGYVLARACWGQGLMREALDRVVQCAFVDLGIDRVAAVCDVDNHRSARLLEKAGFQREGIRPGWALHPNISDVPRDCYSFFKARRS